MIFLHIDPTTNNTNLFNKYLEEGKHMYVLFYMEGCGPCNATRPEWNKIQNVLQDKYSSENNIVIVDIDQELFDKLKNLKFALAGFPTIKYIHNKGKDYEDYEESSIENPDRTVDSFVKWIELKMNENKYQSGGRPNINKNKSKRNKSKKNKHKSKNNKTIHKWSIKYKKGINCNKPKGFSQKQYCKYGRNHKK